MVPDEAAKASRVLADAGLSGRALNGSVLNPSLLDQGYDVAVGNPPFVRFQFVSTEDRTHIDELGKRIGVPFKGVSNLWIPVLLTALSNLRDGGVFSFIIPAECFTGLSARAVRTWLGQHATQLRVDLFPPKSFPGVLQEVVILSGKVTRGSAHGANVFVFDHAQQDSWRHILDESAPTWTGLLLRPDHLDAVDAALELSEVRRFGDVAKLSVATWMMRPAPSSTWMVGRVPYLIVCGTPEVWSIRLRIKRRMSSAGIQRGSWTAAWPMSRARVRARTSPMARLAISTSVTRRASARRGGRCRSFGRAR